MRQIVDAVVSDTLQTLFEWNPHIISAICTKALAAQAASVAAKAAREMVPHNAKIHYFVFVHFCQ